MSKKSEYVMSCACTWRHPEILLVCASCLNCSCRQWFNRDCCGFHADSSNNQRYCLNLAPNALEFQQQTSVSSVSSVIVRPVAFRLLQICQVQAPAQWHADRQLSWMPCRDGPIYAIHVDDAMLSKFHGALLSCITMQDAVGEFSERLLQTKICVIDRDCLNERRMKLNIIKVPGYILAA